MHPVSASASQASARVVVITARSLVLATQFACTSTGFQTKLLNRVRFNANKTSIHGTFHPGLWGLGSEFGKSELSKLKILALTWLLNIARLLSTRPRQRVVKTTLASEGERWSSTCLGLSICQPPPKRPEWISSKPILNSWRPRRARDQVRMSDRSPDSHAELQESCVC